MMKTTLLVRTLSTWHYLSIADIHPVPPLEGFVMNRVIGDYFENLLYKLFVSVDERTNVEQLASVLQMDVVMIKVNHFVNKHS